MLANDKREVQKMSVIQVSARVDKTLRDEAQKVFDKQGLDVSTVIKMLITKTAYEQQIPLSLFSQSETSFPSGWFSPERVEAREKISALSKKSEAKMLDFSKSEDVKEFFDEEFPEYEDLM